MRCLELMAVGVVGWLLWFAVKSITDEPTIKEAVKTLCIILYVAFIIGII